MWLSLADRHAQYLVLIYLTSIKSLYIHILHFDGTSWFLSYLASYVLLKFKLFNVLICFAYMFQYVVFQCFAM